MKIDIDSTEDLFVEHSKAIEEVLQHAVRQALLAHKRIGNPVASWENGKVVLVQPADIPVDDPLVSK